MQELLWILIHMTGAVHRLAACTMRACTFPNAFDIGHEIDLVLSCFAFLLLIPYLWPKVTCLMLTSLIPTCADNHLLSPGPQRLPAD